MQREWLRVDGLRASVPSVARGPRMTPEEEPDDLFADGPTKWEVDQAIRRETSRQQRARNDALIARWREAHPTATCADSVVLKLVNWEQMFPHAVPGRQPERKP